jgi:hypothetical protein
VRLKNRFFSFLPMGGEKCSARRQTQKPSSGMKEPFRGSVAHAYFPRGKRKSFLPKYIPPSRSENQLFSATLLGGQKE